MTTANEFSAASLAAAYSRLALRLANRTDAERVQDAYAQAALAYDNATTAAIWADEDRDMDGGAERLERCRVEQRARLQVLLTAMEAWDSLSQAERNSISLRTPLDADGAEMTTGELNAARNGAANAL